MKIAVTGASGMLGTAVCGLLAARHHEVIAIHRGRSSLGIEEVSEVLIDDLATADWSTTLPGVDAVVHLAAHVHRSEEDGSEFERVNHEATKRLLGASLEAGVRRFLFVSSVAVYGIEDGVALDEMTPCAPTTPYGRSKLRAEEEIRSRCTEAMDYVILRPPMVYGARAKAKFLQLLRFVDRGVPLPLASLKNRRSLISAANAASAVAASLEVQQTLRDTFVITDGDSVSTAEFIRRIAHALNRPPRLFPFPPSILRFALRLLGLRRLSRGLLETLTFDVSKIERAIGWKPGQSMDDGLAEAAAWYRGAR